MVTTQQEELGQNFSFLKKKSVIIRRNSFICGRNPNQNQERNKNHILICSGIFYVTLVLSSEDKKICKQYFSADNKS